MPVYLDHNATTPFDSRVLEAMMPHLTEHHGKPSSVHRYSRVSRAAIDRARQQVADLVKAHPGQMIFMNDGTQAGNFAIKGVAARRRASRWLKLAGKPRFGEKGK